MAILAARAFIIMHHSERCLNTGLCAVIPFGNTEGLVFLRLHRPALSI